MIPTSAGARPFTGKLQPRSLLARAMLWRCCMGRWGCVRVIYGGESE